jgi:putative membrane protein
MAKHDEAQPNESAEQASAKQAGTQPARGDLKEQRGGPQDNQLTGETIKGARNQEQKNDNSQTGNRMSQGRQASLLAVMLLPMVLFGCGGNGSSTNNANTTAVNPANTNAKQSTLSSSDREFMSEAATGGLMEVELGRLAAQKAQSADVKKFGQKMVDDHSKANTELKQLASSKGVTLPADLTSEQKEERDKLAKLSGAEFDHKYIELMVEDHDKDVKAFQDEANAAGDPDLKAFVTRTLPTLQEHQRMAHAIHDKH